MAGSASVAGHIPALNLVRYVAIGFGQSAIEVTSFPLIALRACIHKRISLVCRRWLFKP